MNKIYTKLKVLELHHQTGLFLSVMLLTIIITRIGVLFYNPNPFIFDFELHHFDYGLLLLFTTSLLMLFGSEKTLSNLILTGVAFGLILDDIWFIRTKNLATTPIGDLTIYNSTLPFVTIILILTSIIIVLVGNKSQKKKITKTSNKE